MVRLWIAEPLNVLCFNILVGKLPFEAQTAKETAELLEKARYELSEDSWAGILEEKKSLVRGLLQADVR